MTPTSPVWFRMITRTWVIFHLALIINLIFSLSAWTADLRDQDGFLNRLSFGSHATGEADPSSRIQPTSLGFITDEVRLDSSYTAPSPKPSSIDDHPTISEAQGTLGLRVDSGQLLGDYLGDAEISYTSPDPQARERQDIFRHRMIRLGLTATQGPFRYGVKYRTAGKSYLNDGDQERQELWGEWQFERMRLNTSLSQQWDNVEKNPAQSRITEIKGRMGLAFTPSSWPEVHLSYARSASSSSFEPEGGQSQQTMNDTIDTSFSYQGSLWDAKLASTFSRKDDKMDPNLATVGFFHTLSGAYRPTNSLTLTPNFTLRHDLQRLTGVQSQTPAASLSLTYTPSDVVNVTASGDCTQTVSSDGLVDNTTCHAKSGFTLTYQDTSPIQATFSMDTEYKSYVNTIDPTASTNDFNLKVNLKVAGF